MTFQDFNLDSTGDLNIANGDFVVAPSDVQHVDDILTFFAGSWKQFPILGVGLIQYLKSENSQAAINLIKQQLQSDGYSISNVKIQNNQKGLIVSFPNGIARNT